MDEQYKDILNDHIDKIARLETDMEHIKDKVNDLSDLKDAIIKLTVLQEEQSKRNDKFDGIFEESIKANVEFSLTLKNINESLSNMNEEIKDTNDKVDKIEDNFEKSINVLDDKVEKSIKILDKKIENNENKSKLDIRDIQKDSFSTWCKKNPFQAGIGLIVMIDLLRYLLPVLAELAGK